MPILDLNPEEYQPQPPERHDYGIGLIGCGNVARGAHLPAYRQFGYKVVACCDLNEPAMRQAQAEFDIPFGTTEVDALLARPEVQIVDHGIHYIDLSRFFTGRTPVCVKATTTNVPGQAAVSPMIYSILCEYESGAQVMTTLHFNNLIAASGLHRYEWFMDGTEGSLVASQSEVAVCLKENPEAKITFPVRGRWFPDAFGGSMGEMMRALAEDREPQTSGRDNLSSIRIAYAAVESSSTGEAVELGAGDRG